MMINPLVQFLGIEPVGSVPGLPTAEGAPKGLFAMLFGEQQAALLAETTGAPVLLWPDGTLSAAIEGEAIPPGALLVLPDGTMLTAYDQHGDLLLAADGDGDSGSDAVPAAGPSLDSQAALHAHATSAKEANAESVSKTTALQQSQRDGSRLATIAKAWNLDGVESGQTGRIGGMESFTATMFAAHGSRLEAGISQDALRVLAAPVPEGDPAPQSFARTDAVRPAGESASLLGQALPQAGSSGLDARNEAAALRAGVMAERPTLNTLGEFTVRAVRVLSADGEHSMTVRLVPESLGGLKITLRTVGESVHLHVAAASAAVRDAFDGQMQGLRDALSREGIDLARVTVGSETAGQQDSARQPGDDPGHARTHASGPITVDAGSAAHENAAGSYRHAPRGPDALLDLFA